MTLNTSLQLSFVGDMAVNWRHWPKIKARQHQWTESSISGLFQESVCVVGNLECVPLPDNFPHTHSRLSYAPAQALEYMHAFGINIFSLANNHIMDAGLEGLRAAQELLDASNLLYFGAGETRDRAEAPLMLEKKQLRLAFLGACDCSYAWSDTNSPGVAPMLPDRLLGRLRNIRDHADKVIFILHAGLEFQTLPEPDRVKLCRALADCGASAIVQHQSHVIQPVEMHNGTPILYSLGNFCFEIEGNLYQQYKPHVRNGMIAHITLADKALLRVDHTYIDADGMPYSCLCPDTIAQILKVGADALRSPDALQTVWQKSADHETFQFLTEAWWAFRRGGVHKGYAALHHSLSQPLMRSCLRTTLSRGLF
jgi:hypothetical protein